MRTCIALAGLFYAWMVFLCWWNHETHCALKLTDWIRHYKTDYSFQVALTNVCVLVWKNHVWWYWQYNFDDVCIISPLYHHSLRLFTKMMSLYILENIDKEAKTLNCRLICHLYIFCFKSLTNGGDDIYVWNKMAICD